MNGCERLNRFSILPFSNTKIYIFFLGQQNWKRFALITIHSDAGWIKISMPSNKIERKKRRKKKVLTRKIHKVCVRVCVFVCDYIIDANLNFYWKLLLLKIFTFFSSSSFSQRLNECDFLSFSQIQFSANANAENVINFFL